MKTAQHITIKPPDFGNPKYAGKYVVSIGSKIVGYGSLKKASKIADEIEKKTNQQTAFTYVPKPGIWTF